MGDLSTYSLEDFFPFLPEVYFRLFVRLNEGWWPLPLVALTLGAVALALAWRGRGRLVGVLLGICWAFVGYAFFLDLYANLNWAGTYFGWAFIGQGGLLALGGALGWFDRAVAEPAGQSRWVGLALAIFALVVFPLLEPLTGAQEWAGAEIFGMSPDPTVIATMGVVLLAGRVRWPLLLVPVAWCAISGATTWVMEAPVGLATPLCAAVALISAGWAAASSKSVDQTGGDKP